MEDVLDTYQRSYDDNEVLVCMDETSRQLVRETRVPRPAAGSPPWPHGGGANGGRHVARQGGGLLYPPSKHPRKVGHGATHSRMGAGGVEVGVGVRSCYRGAAQPEGRNRGAGGGSIAQIGGDGRGRRRQGRHLPPVRPIGEPPPLGGVHAPSRRHPSGLECLLDSFCVVDIEPGWKSGVAVYVSEVFESLDHWFAGGPGVRGRRKNVFGIASDFVQHMRDNTLSRKEVSEPWSAPTPR